MTQKIFFLKIRDSPSQRKSSEVYESTGGFPRKNRGSLLEGSKVGVILGNHWFWAFFRCLSSFIFSHRFFWKNRCDFRIRRKILPGGRYLGCSGKIGKGSYKNNSYVKNVIFPGTEIYRNFCSEDSRWKCRYCTKNENNNAIHQYFYVSAEKIVLSSIFTVFPEQKFQISWFSKFLFRTTQNWFPKWFKMIFLRKIMKTLKKLTPLKFWGPGTKFS